MRSVAKKTGFVLIELIIATAILAAVIPLSKFFIDTIRFAREAKIQQTANHLAQLHMEEYKVIDLKDVKDFEGPANNSNYGVKIKTTPFLMEGELRNCIGKVEVSCKSPSEIVFKFANGSTIEPLVLSGEELLLEISNIQLKVWNNNTLLGSSSISLAGEPELDLFVKDNPDFTLAIKNDSDIRVNINRVDIGSNSNFKLEVRHGKVGIRDDVESEGYQCGAHVVVSVTYKGEPESRAMVSQTRFIEWAKSRGVE